MTNVARVRQPELSGSIEEDITNAMNDRGLLSLTHVHHFQQAPITLSQIKNVAKHLLNKLINL